MNLKDFRTNQTNNKFVVQMVVQGNKLKKFIFFILIQLAGLDTFEEKFVMYRSEQK